MAFEIDFLPVGDGERSGDAIALRVGKLAGGAERKEQAVVVLDGGTKESGANLVNHIQKHYKTAVVDFAVCTHSDADHASGLTEVLENLDVRHLYMHLPWKHVGDLEDQLKKASATDSVRQHFRKSLDSARALETLANKRKIKITEPFSDTLLFGERFAVLGPSTRYYEGLLESFRCADELNLRESLLQKIMATAEKAKKWVAETWSSETLTEPGEDDCSAENNSSVILLLRDGTSKFLFTSDAGVEALTEAANYAQSNGVDLNTITGIQVPHHGSKHNVGPVILDRIVGSKVKEGANSTRSAIVSVATAATKHPSKRVVNAFIRRGAKVIATQGNTILHHTKDAPHRGWNSAVPLEFNTQVEAD